MIRDRAIPICGRPKYESNGKHTNRKNKYPQFAIQYHILCFIAWKILLYPFSFVKCTLGTLRRSWRRLKVNVEVDETPPYSEAVEARKTATIAKFLRRYCICLWEKADTGIQLLWHFKV
jgi:hypothetical protein